MGLGELTRAIFMTSILITFCILTMFWMVPATPYVVFRHVDEFSSQRPQLSKNNNAASSFHSSLDGL